jgi:hypothetical protein
LFDQTAREDERHDAVMDIGKYDDARALNALLRVAFNSPENDFLLDACGESIAEILVGRNEFNGDLVIESKSGLNQFRMDLNHTSPHKEPHIHLIEYEMRKNRKFELSNERIFPTDVNAE